jgi:hypothetical protein
MIYAASFAGTILFGLFFMAAVVVLATVYANPYALAFALAGAGLAYATQAAATASAMFSMYALVFLEEESDELASSQRSASDACDRVALGLWLATIACFVAATVTLLFPLLMSA